MEIGIPILFDHLAPPRFPPIEVDGGSKLRLVRDADGNALGGVRIPGMDAPMAVQHGVGDGASPEWLSQPGE